MSWSYRQVHNVISLTGSTLRNYNLKYTVIRGTGTSSGNTIYIPSTKLKSDYSDLRFLYNGMSVPYYDLTQTGDTRIIYVKIPRLLPSSGTDISILYGNDDAISVSSPEDTFLFFNDCKSLTGWTKSTSGVEIDAGTKILVYSSDATEKYAHSKLMFNEKVNYKKFVLYGNLGSTRYNGFAIYGADGENAYIQRTSYTGTIYAQCGDHSGNTSTTFESDVNMHYYTWIFNDTHVYIYVDDTLVFTGLASSYRGTFKIYANTASAACEADKVFVMNHYFDGTSEQVTYGTYTSEESGGFICRNYDVFFESNILYYDFRNNNYDLTTPQYNATTTSINYATDRFGESNSSANTLSMSVASTGDFVFLAKDNCLSTTSIVLSYSTVTADYTLLGTDNFNLKLTTSNKIKLSIYNGTNYIINSEFDYTLDTDTIYHVTVTVDYNIGSAYLYISGSNVASLAVAAYYPSTSTNSTVTIGNGSTTVQISDYMVNDRCFTATEVYALYNLMNKKHIYPIQNRNAKLGWY